MNSKLSSNFLVQCCTSLTFHHHHRGEGQWKGKNCFKQLLLAIASKDVAARVRRGQPTTKKHTVKMAEKTSSIHLATSQHQSIFFDLNANFLLLFLCDSFFRSCFVPGNIKLFSSNYIFLLSPAHPGINNANNSDFIVFRETHTHTLLNAHSGMSCSCCRSNWTINFHVKNFSYVSSSAFPQHGV